MSSFPPPAMVVCSFWKYWLNGLPKSTFHLYFGSWSVKYLPMYFCHFSISEALSQVDACHACSPPPLPLSPQADKDGKAYAAANAPSVPVNSRRRETVGGRWFIP